MLIRPLRWCGRGHRDLLRRASTPRCQARKRYDRPREEKTFAMTALGIEPYSERRVNNQREDLMRTQAAGARTAICQLLGRQRRQGSLQRHERHITQELGWNGFADAPARGPLQAVR